MPTPSGDQTTTGRVIGHGVAILQGVTEVVTGGNMIAGGGTEAVVTSPAATTGVGAVVPAAGVGVAIGGAALVVHGGAVLINTAKNIVNEKSSTPQQGGSESSSGGTGNPFKGKTPQQVDDRFKQKGFEPRGPNPVGGKGGYVNPKTGRSYHIDPGGKYKKGTEQPHVDVNRPKGSEHGKLTQAVKAQGNCQT